MFFPIIFIFSFLFVMLDAMNYRLRDRALLLRAPLSALQVFSGLFAFWYVRPVLQAFAVENKLIAAALIVCIAMLVRRARGYKPAAKFWLAARWFFIIGLPVAGLWFMVFYQSRDRCDKVLADPRVKPLLTLCDAGQWKKLERDFPKMDWRFLRNNFQPRSVFLSSVPGRVYLGTGNEEERAPKQMLALAERATGRVLRMSPEPAVFRGHCDAPTGRCVIALSGAEKLLVFNDGTGGAIKTVKMPARPRFMLSPPHSRALYVGADHAPIVSLFDLDRLKFTRADPGLADYRGVGVPCLGDARDQGMAFMAFNTQRRELNVLPECPIFNTLVLRANERLTRSRHLNMGWYRHLLSNGYMFGVETDPALNELYLSATLDGSVFILDYDTLRVKRKIRLGVGLRETAYDPARHLLFVGHYVNGRLYVIDTRRKKIVRSIFIGKRNRQLIFDPATRHVITTSANGFFEVDVSEYSDNK